MKNMNSLSSSILCLVSVASFMSFPSESAVLKSVQWPPKPPEMVFEDKDKDNIQGIGGKDYPIYGSIPITSFSCSGQLPGFYADQETNCQVFHLCFENHKTSFLCGNGTIFNQRLFTCGWWYNTTCSDSSKYYALNSELYKAKGNATENVNEKPEEDIKKIETRKLETRFQTQKLSRLPILAQSMSARNQHDSTRDRIAAFWRSEATNKDNVGHQSKSITQESTSKQDNQHISSDVEFIEEEDQLPEK